MVMPIVLSNGRQWPTQAEAVQHFHAMLGRYADGDPISDSEDIDDLTALFVRYENWLLRRLPPRKLEEVVSFSRQLIISDQGSHSAFFFHLPNGASREFSHAEAIQRPWSS